MANICELFLPVSVLPLHSLVIISFNQHKDPVFITPILSKFSMMICNSMYCGTFTIPKTMSMVSCFPPGILIVTAFVLKLIHLKLTPVYCTSYGVRVLFFHMDFTCARKLMIFFLWKVCFWVRSFSYFASNRFSSFGNGTHGIHGLFHPDRTNMVTELGVGVGEISHKYSKDSWWSHSYFSPFMVNNQF